MRHSFLLPSRFKLLGWLTFVLFTALGLLSMYFEFEIPGFQLYYPDESSDGLIEGFKGYNLTNELCYAGVVLSLLMICLTRAEQEDEYIMQIRLYSWQWAFVFSYIVLILINFSFYGFTFFTAIFFNTLTLPIVFICRFYYQIYRLKHAPVNEEAA